jgi:hypothetical protein
MQYTSKMKVVRHTKTVPEDYGYVGTRQRHFQELLLVKTFGERVVSKTVVDTEEVPIDAIIDLACFGSTAWRSKWVDAFPEAYER